MIQMALLFALLASGCGGGGGSSVTTAPATSSYADQFDSLWNTFDQKYSYFVYKNIDWDALKATYRPQAIQAASQDQFMQILGQMLSNLHDLHVNLINPDGQTIPTFTPTAFVNFDQSVWRQYLQTQGTNVQQVDPWAATATLGGVAYIAIGSWASSSGPETADLDAALEPFQNAPGIIIDVRMNGGGDGTTASNFAGRFADETRTAGYDQFRDGPAHTDFGPLLTRQVVPRGPWQYKGPVLLLIGRGCYSSTEDFITQMRVLHNVTVVGDTSGGHSGYPITANLSDGWQYTVSTWIDYTAEMQVIEDRGIDPAIFVPATAADFQAGKDPVLDFAISHFTQ
jgi:C-terminal processing protease CtpA/Prc